MRKLGESQPPQKKPKPFLKVFLISFLLLALTIGALFLLNIHKFFLKGPQTVVQLITDSGLKNTDGRTNVLMLGIGGAGHEGPSLTDTIMVASIEKDGKDVALISIPRDMWSPTVSAKINSAYAFGLEKGDGIDLAKKSVEEAIGLPIHYVGRVDFRGFTRAVDLVEGLDLEVETAFVDTRYPIPGKEDDLCGLTIETEEKDGQKREVVKDATGSATPLSEITDLNNPFTCRFETISFKKGPSHMDGITALKFVRSRHGSNNEGSDFARSARQQKVLIAFREKVLSTETLTSPKTIIDLSKSFGESIDTNIGGEEVPFFVKLFKDVQSQSVRRIVLDSGRDESVLAVGDPASHGGQYVLIPKSGNYEDLENYIKGEVFKTTEKQATETNP